MALNITQFTPGDKRRLKQFVQFPLKLYKNDPNYVPQMKMELLGNKLLGVKGLLTKDHPFHKQADIHYFMVIKGKEVLGRLACCINHRYNSYHNVKVGSFGFFEVIEDYGVAKQLLDQGVEWVRQMGMTEMMGPLNFSQDETLGILIEGFEYFPYINTVYNKRYYQGFLERYGFTKAKDLIAQRMSVKLTEETRKRHERLDRIVERIKRKKDITIRSLHLKDKKRFIEDVKLMKDIYNDAWAGNWGILPVTEEESLDASESLKLIADPGLVNFAYVKGKPAAMIINLPDVNEMTRSGNSFWGRSDYIKLLKIVFRRRKVKRVRLWALGILKEYQKIGLDAVLYHESFKYAQQKGHYEECEISWLLEDNVLVLRAGESMGAKQYKTWRIFKLPISS
ncbi:MAG: hypothetical protein IEMM0008_0058 [bacterium]|nr:MAG: hypothetical protein IEMM0008_0058 [bacterium]